MDCTLNSSLNYVSDILDEIALEGLDGITVEALWMRLSVRPKFLILIDESSKEYLWNIVVRLRDLKFYEIPEPRPSLKYYDYSVTEESICNVCYQLELIYLLIGSLNADCYCNRTLVAALFQEIRMELDQVYTYCSVKNISGVFGSCQHYTTRVDITADVAQMTVEEVELKWGNKLVIVASQECRKAALMGEDSPPNVDFSSCPLLYEMLEWIGRSRQLGSLTCGKGSLQTLVVDVKSSFHYIKGLMNYKLVKKQSLLGSLSSNAHASLVYLTRFFEETTNENISMLQLAVEALKMRPPHFMMPCEELYALFDKSKRKRIRKYKSSVVFKRYITLVTDLPYRTIYPDAPLTESEKKSKGEKTIRCFKLINPNLNLSDIAEKESDSGDEEETAGFLPRGIYYKNMPIVYQAYHHIKNSGPRGVNHTELGRIMGLNKCFIRGLIKRLVGDKLCKFYIETVGKHRSKRYIVGEHAQTKEAASEITKILLETTNKSDSKPEQKNCKSLLSKAEKREKSGKRNLPKLEEENMSFRKLKRLGLIIKTVKINRFRLFHQIYKFVLEEEKKEGLNVTVDRQTVQKLLEKLEGDGLIRKIVLTGKDNDENSIKIFADPTFDPDEKMKENIYATHSSTSISSEQKESLSSTLENGYSFSFVENQIHMQRLLGEISPVNDKPCPRENEFSSLYSPKFIRLNVLHEFMFHLVYDYTGSTELNQEHLIEEMCKSKDIDEYMKIDFPQLFEEEISPFMFVPPLSSSGRVPGWFLISDLLIRMPLSIMVKIFKIAESNPELWTYLNHPVKKHYLVKDIPVSLRRMFFCRKNPIFNFYYDVRRLTFMGLLQFGPKFGKEHYQTMLYLNRKASLLDTSLSHSTLSQLHSDEVFNTKFYEFQTKADVKKYWMDMFDICMGTKLSSKQEELAAEREISKESLKKCYEPKSIKEAAEQDNGTIPGDHLGAAGLDSSMFSFLRSNWTGSVIKGLSKGSDNRRKKKPKKVPFQKLKELKKFDKDVKKFGVIKTRRRVIGVNIEKPNKKVVKQEPETKSKRVRQSSYDETDLEALKLMNTLRVTWSSTEDSLLLLCRVAMMFLCPKMKSFSKIPCSEFRRALQYYVPESRNKTQRSIARRIVYMMKNPTTARNVNLCLESLKLMPESKLFECQKLVEKIKPTAVGLEELQRELFEKFHKLLAFLKDRFIDNPTIYPGKVNIDLIPNTLEEFLEKFDIDVPKKEDINVKNIRENVIRGTLMSSFCCRSDKTSSAVQLFDIYRQYNEDELQKTIKSLHINRVITVRKKAGHIYKKGNILPLTFTPFKLSFAFQHMLNMRYAHSLYSGSYAIITKLLEVSDKKDIPVDSNECNVPLYPLASLDILTFKATLPEQIVAVDREDFSDSSYSKMLLKYCKMLDYSQSNSKVVCTSGKVISKPEELAYLQRMPLKKRRLSDPGIVQSKKGKCDGITTLKGANKYGVEQEVLEELKTQKHTRSSRVILYMMREEAKKDASDICGDTFTKDICVVNSSQISIELGKFELEKLNKEMNPSIANSIIRNIIGRSLYPVNLVDEELVLKSAPEFKLKAAKATLDFITSKKELGASLEDLKLNCYHESLNEILNHLINSKVIIKSGINETRFVSQNYSSPWLLSSFKMKRIEREKLKPNEAKGVALRKSFQEPLKKRFKGILDLQTEEYSPPACSSNINNKIKLIIRPWIRIDGSLNRKVLDRFLGTILGFVLSHPGCQLKKIMNKFEPYFTPVWTKDLVEILYEIGCLNLKTLVVIEKTTLFSKSHIEICDKYTGVEDDLCVLVEAKVNAIITLGLFIGKKTYSKDFLSD